MLNSHEPKVSEPSASAGKTAASVERAGFQPRPTWERVASGLFAIVVPASVVFGAWDGSAGSLNAMLPGLAASVPFVVLGAWGAASKWKRLPAPSAAPAPRDPAPDTPPSRLEEYLERPRVRYALAALLAVALLLQSIYKFVPETDRAWMFYLAGCGAIIFLARELFWMIVLAAIFYWVASTLVGAIAALPVGVVILIAAFILSSNSRRR